MQVRFTTAQGLPVVDDEMTEQFGSISGILIHPDTARVEGFFVHIPGFLRSFELFLSSMDILRWGLRVVVRDAQVLAPVEELIRLAPLLEEGRVLLGRPIVTKSGKKLGVCRDVQFDTQFFMMEWIWPRRWLRWRTPLPASQILEVTREAIIVKDEEATRKEEVPVEAIILPPVPEAA